MSEIKDGGQAFPLGYCEGMSLRDWFAGQALTGMCGVDSATVDDICQSAKEMGVETETYLAISAYSLADAMLAARAEGK